MNKIVCPIHPERVIEDPRDGKRDPLAVPFSAPPASVPRHSTRRQRDGLTDPRGGQSGDFSLEGVLNSRGRKNTPRIFGKLLFTNWHL